MLPRKKLQVKPTLGTHVVAETGASSYIIAHSNQTTSNLNFNGDVTTVLNKGTIHIDKIGEIGVANSSGNWTLTPTGGTNNADIRRNYNISLGDTSWANCKSEWSVFSEDSTHNLGHHNNICGVDPDLNLTLGNPQTIGNVFQFDIIATSTGSNTYLDYVPIDLTYNAAAFGTHAVANNNVTVTLGPSFSISNGYLDPQTTLGDGIDTIGVAFSTNNSASSWNRTLITSTPVVLLTVKINIQGCNTASNINFFNLSFTSAFDWYYANANDDPNTATQYFYDNTTEGSGIT